MWLNVISINLMQLSKRGTFVETAYPRLPSNRRARQSVELFTSVADEQTHDSLSKFCVMLCKILNRDLNMFGFGSHHRNSFSNFNRALKIKSDFFFFPKSVTTLDKITLEIRLLILLLVWVII